MLDRNGCGPVPGEPAQLGEDPRERARPRLPGMWHMGVSVWSALPVPEARPEATAGWHEQPGATSALAGLRRRLRTALDDGILPTGSDDGERLLLVVEELVSNALRHGRSPVHVHITAHARGWVTAVSDAAADQP